MRLREIRPERLPAPMLVAVAVTTGESDHAFETALIAAVGGYWSTDGHDIGGPASSTISVSVARSRQARRRRGVHVYLGHGSRRVPLRRPPLSGGPLLPVRWCTVAPGGPRPPPGTWRDGRTRHAPSASRVSVPFTRSRSSSHSASTMVWRFGHLKLSSRAQTRAQRFGLRTAAGSQSWGLRATG